MPMCVRTILHVITLEAILVPYEIWSERCIIRSYLHIISSCWRQKQYSHLM